jgi:hypothetical protein
LHLTLGLLYPAFFKIAIGVNERISQWIFSCIICTF